ncbi:SDR family NAD(P)-dependent oxidoreductase [Rhodovulum sp. 12E13]|uniref:SDR family NAD(P)-dependent oxidoreductase n=1 Tax=Rhodovulum sp. 12E13 TaxID=2203891 RepID=UPI000E1ABDAC|nr:SDR family NAD(P)-dependent oxidoreductase [Rhodovulum sp. 12E13]RDC71811.1 SDR family NAD(P)-dependent oxidoreductase [Rhodovulum sp. 12E13]
MSALAGRSALVTGGGTGLGADLARGLAAAGAEVWIAGRTEARLSEVAESAPRIHPVVADVTDEASVAAMFDRVGAAEIVIANAGASESAPLARTGLEAWERMLSVNLTGVFLTFREAVRRLGKTPGWGRLIAVASTAGLKGYPYVSAYSAAKHGVVGLVRSTALELARTGATANALCPGFLDTEMTERSVANIAEKTGMSAEDARAGLEAMSPQRRLIRPAEVTAAALWLCGPGSEGITGQAIAIAGGEA